jgi:hypothetical protein
LHGLWGSDEKPGRILFPDQDLFLAQEIEVLVTAEARIDDGGKVPGEIAGVTANAIRQRKGEGNFQRDLGRTHEFAVFPRLAVNRDFPP